MRQAEVDRKILLENNQTFAFETVFSNPDKLDFINLARSKGYEVHIIFVTTSDPSINIRRVKKRFENGGHNVKSEAVIRHYDKSMNLLPYMISAADRVLLYDNSEEDGTPKLVMEKNDQFISICTDGPAWFNDLIDKLKDLGIKIDCLD